MPCYYAEFHYAECRILFTVSMNVVMLSVVRLNVIMLSVVASHSDDTQLSKGIRRRIIIWK